VLLSGQVYVTCAPKHNIVVFIPEVSLLYTIGRALKGKETPEEFINAFNFTPSLPFEVNIFVIFGNNLSICHCEQVN